MDNSSSSSSKPSEKAWLIERASSDPSAPQYFAGYKHGQFLTWTYNHLKAVRFSRKEDAEQMDLGEEVRVCEHAWDN